MRFVQEYLVDFNAAAAYRPAGYRGAAVLLANNASRLLASKRVQRQLQAYRQQVPETTSLSVDRLARELEAIRLQRSARAVRGYGRAEEPGHLDESTARAVSSIELGDKVKITLWDKLGAIEKALKLLNAYPDRKQDAPAQTIVGVVIVPAKGSPASHARQRPALEGQARPVQRVAPPAREAKPFKVPAARDRFR